MDQLRSFLSVAERGSFKEAAEAEFRSPPLVTQRIKKLEKTLGVDLLERSRGKGAALTEAGKQFLVVVSQMLRRFDLSVAVAKQPGRVRLGLPSDAFARLRQLLETGVTAFLPQLQLSTVTDLSTHLLRDFERLELDVVIFRALEGTLQRHASRPLYSEPLCWVAAREIHIDENCLVPLATFRDGNLFRTAAIDSLSLLGRPWRLACVSAEVHIVQAAATAGMGVAVLPCSLVPDGTVVLEEKRHGFPPLPDVHLSIAAHGDVNPLFEQVADLLVQHWGEPRAAA
ncbi:lysR family transcriptional regulator [Bordetella ansorpii]|uniref:LysR family transcriptional regulator n=1 Tax=Bordetella ansorpii TaxID=288768 RepID=A0A157SRE0_9BORD|nr:LysR family transcriptional regulator [Bordetella ansorpii]SAI72999.1 lysR family transcriptional regulator [Bordetella ansorpii]